MRDLIDTAALDRFENFWKTVVCDTSGRLNRRKVARALFGFDLVVKEVSIVYDQVTGGVISKPGTPAVHVLAAVNDADNEALAGILTDEKEKWEAEREEGGQVTDVVFVRLGGHHDEIPDGRFLTAHTPEGEFKCLYWLSRHRLYTAGPGALLPDVWHETVAEAARTLIADEKMSGVKCRMIQAIQESHE